MYIVAIIFLNYNTAPQCLEAVDNINRLKGKNRAKIYTIVVDNNSKADDRALLEAGIAGRSGVELILSPENRGYSAGNNLGLRRASDWRIPYAIVANSDIDIITEDFADKLIEFDTAQAIGGLVGPRIYFPSGAEQFPLQSPTLASALGLSSPLWATDGGRVYATTGCFLFGSMQTWQTLSFLDETIFLYREEWALAERHVVRGLSWRLTDSVTIIHRHVRKTATSSSVLWHKRQERLSTRYVMRKYLGRNWLYLAIYDVLLTVKTCAMLLRIAAYSSIGASASGSKSQR
jgi:GT2 family glycosyltransferase